MKGSLLSFGIIFLFAFSMLALPDMGYAQNSEPLVPCNGPDCKACHVVALGQRIMTWLIEISVAIIALVFAIGGFKMIMSAGNPGAVTTARGMMANSIIGFVILLTSYLIIDTIMKQVAGGNLGPWNEVKCVGPDVVEGPEVPGEPGECPIPALAAITDPLAQQMEGGQTVIWENTSPQLQACVNKFTSKVGGSVTSAYRPPAYQTHLKQIHSKWCAQLRTNSNEACAALKETVSGEMSKHQLSCDRPVGTNSNHSAGTAVDISGPAHGSQNVLAAAQESCLTWYGQGDPVHYQLRSGCTCN